MSKEQIGKRVAFEYGYGVRIDKEPHGPYPIFGSNGPTGFINSYKVEGPGVIIGRKGSVGKVAYSDKNFTPTDTTYYLKILDKSKDDLKFWYYFLQILGLEKLNTHSAVPGLSRELAYLLEVNIPPINLQKNAASVLSLIDSKINCNNRINTELESIAQMLYDYWFVQFDFPNSSGKPYKSSGGAMLYNKSLNREIPTSWQDGTLDDLGQIVGGSTPSTENPFNFVANGTPWITPYDLSCNQGNKFITRGKQDVSAEGIKSASLKIAPSGTVLLSSRAPIGYMAIARRELTTNQGFKSFIPTKKYSSTYIYYTVKGSLKTITQYSSGSTFKEISAGVLKTVKIVLPESDTVDKFTTLVEPIFKRQNLLETENHELAQLRDWLLPMLMNGQVTVS